MLMFDQTFIICYCAVEMHYHDILRLARVLYQINVRKLCKYYLLFALPKLSLNEATKCRKYCFVGSIISTEMTSRKYAIIVLCPLNHMLL